MEAKGFEITGYRLYVFKNNELVDTLQFDRLEDIVNRYTFAKQKGYTASAERVERIIIE